MPHKKYTSSYRIVQEQNQHPALPHLLFCDECKLLGYCKKYATDDIPEAYDLVTSVGGNSTFDLKYYTTKIPFRVDSKLGFSQYAKGHLQTAYDAFHQDDFETALLHFKSIEPGGAYHFQSDYFLSLTYFMLGNYIMADAHMQACVDIIYFKVFDFTPFLNECSRRSVIPVFKNEESNIAKALSSIRLTC